MASHCTKGEYACPQHSLQGPAWVFSAHFFILILGNLLPAPQPSHIDILSFEYAKFPLPRGVAVTGNNQLYRKQNQKALVCITADLHGVNTLAMPFQATRTTFPSCWEEMCVLV